MREIIEFITAGANVKRFHTVTTLQQDTVGHHSHSVAMFCFLLNPEPSLALIAAALRHDLAEQCVGDIPAPAKREFKISDKVSELEDQILASAGLEMPELTPEEQRILKLADIASGAVFCVTEMRMGNSTLSSVFWRYLSYATDMNLRGYELELFDTIKEMAR